MVTDQPHLQVNTSKEREFKSSWVGQKASSLPLLLLWDSLFLTWALRKRRTWQNKELLCSDFEIYTHMPCFLQRSSSLLLTGELSHELTEYSFFPWNISEQWNKFSTMAQQLEAYLTVAFLELFQIALLFNLCGLHISFGLKGWSGGHEGCRGILF